jgi:hypothetical protein
MLLAIMMVAAFATISLPQLKEDWWRKWSGGIGI